MTNLAAKNYSQFDFRGTAGDILDHPQRLIALGHTSSISPKLSWNHKTLPTIRRRTSSLSSISSIIRRMSIKTQLNESMKDAMKSGDEVRKRTVRMVLAAVKQAEVDKRSNAAQSSGSADKRIELDDAAVMNLLQKEIKNRRESLEEAKKANRADLVEANEAEINVLQVFLPKAMPAEELRALVQAAIAETGAASPADMGKVMKTVMPKVAGRAPNDMISTTVRELLQQ